jgi:tRNA U55 pseudouridine synthase TruB
LRARLLPLAAALRAVPKIRVNANGVTDVRQGRALSAERITSGGLPPEGSALVAVLDEQEQLIALAQRCGDLVEIKRGIFG